LIEEVLSEPIWDTTAAQTGIEWWLATVAAGKGHRIAEATAAATVRDETQLVDLSTTIAQLLGFAFTDLDHQVRLWQRVRAFRDAVRVDIDREVDPSPHIDAAALVESFRRAYRDMRELWEEVMPPLAIMQWRRLTTMALESFRIADSVWARTIYDFAIGHRLRVIPRQDLLRSLTPLYLAWLASFVVEMHGASAEAIDTRLVRLRLAFEREKPYLIAHWRWPERFKPVKVHR
jgi:hypothetical protein